MTQSNIFSIKKLFKYFIQAVTGKENEFTKELIFVLKGNLETNLKSLDDNIQFEIKHLKYNREFG